MTRSKFLLTLFGIATAPFIPIPKLNTWRAEKISCWLPQGLSRQIIELVELDVECSKYLMSMGKKTYKTE